MIRHLTLGADTGSGVWCFVIVSALFNANFAEIGEQIPLSAAMSSATGLDVGGVLGFVGLLVLTVGAAHSPDADFVPYLLLRQRMGWISHRVVGHHPLIVLPIAGLVGALIADAYGATLALMAVTAHFVNDTTEPFQGFHWLSPFTFRSVTIGRWPPRLIGEAERREAHQRLKARTAAGGQILGRLGSGPSRLQIAYTATAYAGLAVFVLF